MIPLRIKKFGNTSTVIEFQKNGYDVKETFYTQDSDKIEQHEDQLLNSLLDNVFILGSGVLFILFEIISQIIYREEKDNEMIFR